MRVLLAMLVFAVAVCAYAQGTGNVSLSVEKAPIRQVLDQLFAPAKLTYKLDDSVQGDVTANLSNVPFATALSTVLRQLRLTYEVQGSVYLISAPPPPQEPEPEPQPSGSDIVTVKIKCHHVPSSVMLAMLLGIPRSQYLGPFDRRPDAQFFSVIRHTFWDSVGNPWFFTTGVYFPLWLGGGWENLGGGFGR